jgi:hypothetical protein
MKIQWNLYVTSEGGPKKVYFKLYSNKELYILEHNAV